jgi:hypothetical protein
MARPWSTMRACAWRGDEHNRTGVSGCDSEGHCANPTVQSNVETLHKRQHPRLEGLIRQCQWTRGAKPSVFGRRHGQAAIRQRGRADLTDFTSDWPHRSIMALRQVVARALRDGVLSSELGTSSFALTQTRCVRRHLCVDTFSTSAVTCVVRNQLNCLFQVYRRLGSRVLRQEKQVH